MSEILFHYQRPDPVTWVYLSSLLIFGLFFVFYRFWSLRNVDLALLLMLSPGLLMVQEGHRLQLAGETISEAAQSAPPDPLEVAEKIEAATPDELLDMAESSTIPDDPEVVVAGLNVRDVERWGFIWLLGVAGLICIRLMLDPILTRRPLLAPNLQVGGLTFIGIALFVFLMANVITSNAKNQDDQGPRPGPGYALVNLLPTIPTTPGHEAADGELETVQYAATARVLAIVAQLLVLTGMVFIGQWHFNNMHAGVGAATLYLLLPYTAQMTGRVDHVLPAALLVWAVAFYRRPLTAGIIIGLAAGLVYYPLFLLPLWGSFYWHRGLRRFAYGVGGTVTLLAALLFLGDTNLVFERVRQMFGLWLPVTEGLYGVWGLGWDPIWRLPILVGFIVLSAFFAFWPSQKNLGTLISCSAAVMAAAQFWHGYGGGLYIAWYLPLALLTVYRPNLEDRIALKVIGNGRKRIGLEQTPSGNEAA